MRANEILLGLKVNDVRTPFKIIFLPFARHENVFDCAYPCPCGYYGDTRKPCTCASALVTRYQKRISAPLRIASKPRAWTMRS